MPFQSKQQQKACYATHGFGGKVDCKKWSDMTDQKSLPERKMKEIASHGARTKKKHAKSAS